MLTLLSLALAGPSSVHDALLNRFHAHLSGHAHEEGPACLTGLVRDLKDNWSLFSPAERAEITSVLAPWKADLADAYAQASPPPPPGGAPTETCFGQVGANRLLGTHFSVEWDTGTNQSTAQAFLDALEDAYRVEVEELGWKEPTGLNNYLMLAYIQSGNYAGAYTTVDTCGRDYAPYIVAYAGSFAGGSDWYETMALHEFNHASQFAYGFGPEFWLWEATATYIEEQVAPDNNWWSTYVIGYSDHPEMAINAESQQDQDIFYHMYGMSTWLFYVDQYQAGTDAARLMWEWASDNGSYYDVNVQDMADGIGVDFEAVYPDFVARNAAVEYDEQRYWTPVAEVDEVDALPAGGGSASRTAPGGYGQNYIRFEGNAGDGESTLKVAFQSDESTDWLVELIEVNSNSVLRTAVATGRNDVGVSLASFGDKDVLLAVSPLKHNNNTEYTYSWEATLEEAAVTDPGGTDPGGTDPGGTDPTGDDEGTGSFSTKGTTACGCASGNGAPTGVAAAALALALAIRRKRR